MPAKKKEKLPASTVEELLKKYEGQLFRGSSDSFRYNRIPFDIPALDDLIGGGIPKKRLTILAGQSNAGKSYLASQSVVQIQKNGGRAAWIDTEMSWDPGWMQTCGIDIDTIVLSQPTTGEEAFGLIRDLLKDGVDLVVLDSIAGLVPSAMGDEDFGFNPMAWQARFVNQSLPRIIPSLSEGGALIAINQLRAGIGAVAFLDSMPGGKAQSFFAHLVLQVRREGWIIEGPEKEKVGMDIEIRNRKSKAGGQHQQACTIPFRFNGGFDIVETFIREGIKYDLILKSGAWYQIFDNETKVAGMNNVKQFFLDNPKQWESLVSQVNERGDIDKVRRVLVDAS